MRMAPIRRCLAPVHEPSIPIINLKEHPQGVQTTIIYIKCMHGCGAPIKVVVDVDDIIPKLGRPRGLRKSCHACAARYNSNGMMTNSGHAYI